MANGSRGWRVARWATAAFLLLIPLIMMQLSDEWNWSIGDFLVAAVIIGGVLLLYEAAAARSSGAAYRAGVVVALAACFLQVWINLAVGIVGSTDNPQNQGFFGVVVAAAACAFVARFRPDAMARAMLAVAGVQALLALMVATAPITARDPMGAAGVLMLSSFFIALWLISAAAFWRAARSGEGAQPPARPGAL